MIDVKQILVVQKLWELTGTTSNHSVTFTYSSRHSSEVFIKLPLLIVSFRNLLCRLKVLTKN